MGMNSIVKTVTGVLFYCAIAAAQKPASDSLATSDSLVKSNDTAIQIGTAESAVAPGMDSTAIKAQLMEKNRLTAAALDDSIARCKSVRPVCVLGMIAGTAITVVGFVLAEVAAQEKANELSAQSGGTAYVWFWNIPGIFVGIPLTSFCAYKYLNLGGKISIYEWKKKKLKLSVSGNGAMLAGRFQAAF